MKTIAVFGGFGFIGSNLLSFFDRFMQDKYRVIIFDKQIDSPLRLHFKCIYKVYTGDFGNRQDVINVFKENHVDYVFHFLNTTVPATSDDVRFDVESNLLPTIELLETMYLFNVKNIIFLSSGGAVYGVSYGNKHLENDDTFPLSSYGIVKLAIEKYICMYSRRNSISYLILRLSNPYGPFHSSTKQGIINVAIKKSILNEKLTVWGNGQSKKDYIFVEDFINILMKLVEINVYQEIINVGSGYLHSVNEILENVKAIQSSFEWEYTDKKEFDNVTFELSTKKLRGYFKNFKFTPLDKGIKKTFDWMENSQ